MHVGVGEEGVKLAHKATVGSVFVAPQHRRKGIGRALMSALIARAKEGGKLSQLTLTVSATNDPVMKLYKDLGFSVLGQSRMPHW